MEDVQVIQGEDIYLLIDDTKTAHATSHNLSIEVDMKDFRTKDTNGKQVYPGDVSWSADGEGLIVVDDSLANTAFTPAELLTMVLNKTRFPVVLNAPDLTGLASFSGYAYFSSISLSASAGDQATYSYSITGDGNLLPPDEDGDAVAVDAVADDSQPVAAIGNTNEPSSGSLSDGYDD